MPRAALPSTGGPSSAFLGRLRGAMLRYRRPETRIEAAYPAWRARQVPAPPVEPGPLISIILPAHRTPPDLLMAAIASVRAQTYPAWELCAAHDASANMQVLGVQAALDRRIKTIRQRGEAGIAAASNDALALATGEFVTFLDHDDELAADALAALAAAIKAEPEADMVFTDEDQLVGERHCRPYFKPGWNPDLLLAQNCVCHLAVYRRSLLQQLGGLRPGLDGSQDYDLALRASRLARRIRHVPVIGYSWFQNDDGFSARSPELCARRARQAVAEHLGAAVRVEPAPGLPHWNRIIHPLPDPAPRVTLILPDGAGAPADAAYPGAIDIATGEANQAAAAARGSVLIFLAPGLAAAHPGWVGELVSHALRPEIACAGARIDAPDGRIRQAGLWLHPIHIAHTLSPGADADDPGYRGQFALARNVAALSRDALAIRRDLFLEAGGFDAACGPYADADLCLRLTAGAARCLWTPHARLRGLVHAPQAPQAAALMRTRWEGRLAADPYGNPHLGIERGRVVLK